MYFKYIPALCLVTDTSGGQANKAFQATPDGSPRSLADNPDLTAPTPVKLQRFD